MILPKIEHYWTGRAKGYSEVNRHELATGQDRVWLREIRRHLPAGEGLKILDVGTGPGFFAILLARAGYEVTAVDYTEAMLREAEKNAGALAERIRFRRMDAQRLDFPDGTFDAVISRNLTWNLECPKEAYAEWMRVLKDGGQLLNFDANWYHHLFDQEKRREYEADRERVQSLELDDHYTCTDIDAMEEIARQVPMSRTMRPAWDLEVLKACSGGQVRADEQVWERVWDQTEKANYASTPMFLVSAVKSAAGEGLVS
ncbi:MAG: class I SAM-dependent methyltransferase [Eubacteriales bacterium]|nr:class I SAM-dependent methyltransferase [Eubacteriales bacterium]